MNNLRVLDVTVEKQYFPIAPPPISTKSINYITVVIGNNATGKSRLLVNTLNGLRQHSTRSKSNDRTAVNLSVNGNQTTMFNFPTSSEFYDKINLISISNSLFDKFPHSRRNESNYTYIGARTEGITHRRSVINDLLDTFSFNLENDLFIKKAKELFDFLGLKPQIKILLKESIASSSRRFDELLAANSNVDTLKAHLIRISNEGFHRQHHKRLFNYANDNHFLHGLHRFLNSEFKHTFNKIRDIPEYTIDLTNKQRNLEFVREYKFFSILRTLNLLTYESIKLRKKDIEYDILDSSTGEIGLLCTFIRAIPAMKSGSIIFIDEPEVSLHPKWQMQYIDLLNKFLKGFKGCHIIIATHSHLILSDLAEEWSSVLVMQQAKNGKIIAELKPHTPLGWSPEAILYEVFGVANVRNHYFEMDVKNLLNLISNDPENHSEIQKRVDRLKRFRMNDDDPVKLLLTEAQAILND